MHITKMHGAGNDFILIDNRDGRLPVSSLPALAKGLCAWHTSVGADGMMVVMPPQGDADYAMLFYNSDGSLGEMCGNGARCICRYGHDKGLAGEVQRVETTAGLVIGERITQREYRVRLNDPSVLRLGLTLCGFVCDYVELGDPGLPHCVVLMDAWDKIPENDLRRLGSMLRSAKELPKGANVSFVKRTGENELAAVTYERGVEDFTLACGTACGSITAVLTLRGLVSGKDVRIKMPGGLLRVSLTRDGDSIRDVFITGPTNVVFEAELTDEDIIIPSPV